MSRNDLLQKMLEDAVATCSRVNIAIVKGWVEPPEPEATVIHCDPETTTEEFIQIAAALRCPMVVIEISRLEQADWDRASEILEGLDTNHEDESSAALRRSILNARDFVGQLASVSLAIFPPGMARIELTQSTAWSDDVFGLLEDNEENDADLDEPDDGGEDDEASEAMVRSLASSAAFQKAKTAAAREFEARKFIRGKDSSNQMFVRSREISQLAKSIFEGEIRAQQEAQTRSKAKEMLDAGLPKSEVAEKLGLTKRELGRLL